MRRFLHLSLSNRVADTANPPLQPPSRLLSRETQVPWPDSRLAELKPLTSKQRLRWRARKSAPALSLGWLALLAASRALPSAGSVQDGISRCWPVCHFSDCGLHFPEAEVAPVSGETQ